MTTLATQLTREARARLLERLAELRGLARLPLSRINLSSPDEPIPLHRTSLDNTTERTAS